MPMANTLGLCKPRLNLREPYLRFVGVGSVFEEHSVAGTSPTVRQRELGKRLRELRSQHDLTVEDVAEKLLCSATKVSRLETGARRPSLRDVRDLCVLYGVDESTSTELMSLARGAREQGWWTHYDDLNLDPYIGLEQVATSITCYSMNYMPALLQTGEYAQAIIKAITPQIDPEIHRQRVEVWLLRQQLLDQDERPRYRVLLDEAVLYRRVGGPELMCAQLDKILQAQRDSKATVQVVPFDLRAYAAQDSNFVLLEFDDPNLSPVVFIEGLTSNQYLERRADITRYREAAEYLRDSALSPHDSIQRINELRESYAGETKSLQMED
jgi:transcriptional regulator with XRE-family HTH domain